MPVDIRQLDISFQGEEANTLFYEPVYMDEDIRSQFRFVNVPGNKKRIAFVQELEKIVRRHTGCGFNPIGSTRVYDRFIEVDRVKADSAICWEEFKDTVFEELLGQGLSFADLSGTVLGTIAETLFRNAIKKDNIRLAYFGDRSSTSPAYDVTDGLWRVIIPEFVAASQTKYTNINSGTPLSAGDGIEILRSVYNNAFLQLKGLPDNLKKIYVSGSVFQQYNEDLENGGGGDAGILRLQNGSTVTAFRNIQVMPMWDWDRIMQEDFATTNAHFVLMTTPQNLALGGDVLDSESSYRIWYDEEKEEVKMKSRYKMGFQVIHPTLLSVAY
jgi:hypothetical protein